MYESFFKLSVKPFDLLSNPDFLFLSRSHRKALTYLDHALQERAGFMLLTGEIGCGKTTLIRELTRRHRGEVIPAHIFNTNVTPEQLIAMVVDDFGLAPKDSDKAVLLRMLYDFLVEQYSRGTKPLLIIDEAQNLTEEALEEVRMLSNLESASGKLLQIIMAGQPELRLKLASPGLKQLRQRISFSCHLSPLNREEIKEYILHRLEVAGNRDAAIFSNEALELIGSSSRGVPRLINIICDYLLLTAFSEETRKITGEMTAEVLNDLDFESQYWGEGQQSRGEMSNTPRADFSIAREEGADYNEAKELLLDDLSGTEDLEKREALSGREVEHGFDERLKRPDRIPQEHIQATNRRLEELQSKGRADNLHEIETPPSPERKPEQKRRFFGKIFRAV